MPDFEFYIMRSIKCQITDSKEFMQVQTPVFDDLITNKFIEK